MNFVPVMTAVLVGAGVGIYCVIRALRTGSSPRSVLLWSASMTALLGAFVLWQLSLLSMLGDASPYFLPTLETKAQRSFLMYYAILSGAFSALITAGLTVVASSIRKA